jgi:DNA polymerase bacteriophage-type
MGGFVILDVETRSTLDLRKVGAARYASHPDTDVWCVAGAVDDQKVQRWLPSNSLPQAILEAAADSNYVFVAHNAGFERAILKHILTPRYGWPEIPVERWRCTMAMALALALPASLAQVAKALSLPEQKANKTIVAQMAKPRQPRGDEDPAAGPYWFDDAEHLQALYEYCEQDVETERALYRWLPPLIPAEQELWQLDQVINDRGFYTDGALIEKAIAISTAAERAVQEELQQVTGGQVDTTNKTAKLSAWLAAHGCIVADLQKATLRTALGRKELKPEARRAIELRLEAAHASATKMQALQTWRDLDGRVRGWAGYHGAGTGRWTARGPQPQNFRKEANGIAPKLDAVLSGDFATVRALGSPIEIVGDVARCAICAPPGNKLLVADYSAIESRVLAWIADEQSKLALWAKFDQTGDPNDDPYTIIGRSLGYPEETARAYGKIADLAFGFGGGLGAYKNFAPGDDNTPDITIEGFKRAWRERHPESAGFWHGIERAAIAAIHRAGEIIRYGRLTLQCRRLQDIPFLFITLPSGRALSYPFARVIATLPRGTPAVSFMDNAIITGGWSEYRPGRGMWGGGFTENIVQAIARDLLAAAMTRLETAGYPVVLHVHDAIVCEVPDGASELPRV